MAHFSEHSKPLPYALVKLQDSAEFAALETGQPDVWCLLLPLTQEEDREKEQALINDLVTFSRRLHHDSLLTVLTSPQQAANLYLNLKASVKFQIWVVVKLQTPISRPGGLPLHHAALLVLSKYRGSLQHTKTRISYTYCPTCERTTKDYGGKKHLYHEYGTLISDIWRDITYIPQEEPQDIITRLRDLFGIPLHHFLHVLDFRRSAPVANMVNELNVKYSSALEEPCASIIANSRLINQDCLRALQDIPSESVDFCFADPPYNIDKKYDNWDDTLDMQAYFHWCDTGLSELARVLKPGRICAILNIPLWAIRHFAYMQTILQFYDWIVWEGLSLPVRMIMPAHYTILAFSKGEPRDLPGFSRKFQAPCEADALYALKENFCSRASCVRDRQRTGISDYEIITDLWWDIHRLKHNSKRVDHPTQLPPKLMYRLISLFTHQGETVLDPFNGSGTTSLTAEQLQRKFIGIELSPYYYELAQKRHDELRTGLDPFRKNGSIPQAKNSRVKRLKKQKYKVTKKTLQLEIRKIAQKLERMPSRDDVKTYSQFPVEYYDEYFISWGEVCAAARTTGMTEKKHTNAQDSSRKKEQLSLFEK